MTYEMTCHCNLEESDLKRINNRQSCKEHGGTIVRRFGICEECGEMFYRGIRGQLGFLCDECAAEKKLQTSYDRKERIRQEKAAAKAAKLGLLKTKYTAKEHRTRGEYCKDITNCKNDKYPACLDCDDFYPRFQGVDPVEIWIVKPEKKVSQEIFSYDENDAKGSISCDHPHRQYGSTGLNAAFL